MAQTDKTASTKAKRNPPGTVPRTAKKASPPGEDAIALLESDHREVEAYFETYETLTDDDEKKALVARICLALKVHAQIEEEIFYPKARTSTGDGELIDEALVEHMGAKSLIAQLEAMVPGQPLYDAKVKVLGEQVRHHVEEEEGELFPEMRETRVDLELLGAKIAARKAELETLFGAALAH